MSPKYLKYLSPPMIHTSLSPNTESDDLWIAFKQLVLPWNWFSWRKGSAVLELEQTFSEYLGAKHAFSMQRGRDALLVLLKSLGISQGDEVILQAYTCIVVPNAIQYTGAKPVYVDIEKKGFNIDPALIEAAITPQTKAVIIQHTFGEPAKIKEIKKICDESNILLIEDCAHALSARYQGQKVGTFGKAAIWSFGRDKIISSTWGGMITTEDEFLANKLGSIYEEISHPSFFQIFQGLMHPLIFAIIKPLYRFKLGKVLLVLSQKLKLVPRVIFQTEKKGKKPTFFPQQMANALAYLALNQLKKLGRFHEHRQKVAKLYAEKLKELPYVVGPSPNPFKKGEPIQCSSSSHLRFPLRHPNAQSILAAAKKEGIYLGDWYTTVLAPADCQLKDFQYMAGSCPRAEKAAEEALNLPTHIQITPKKAEHVVEFLRQQIL